MYFLFMRLNESVEHLPGPDHSFEEQVRQDPGGPKQVKKRRLIVGNAFRRNPRSAGVPSPSNAPASAELLRVA